jgi:hypothetical protein
VAGAWRCSNFMTHDSQTGVICGSSLASDSTAAFEMAGSESPASRLLPPKEFGPTSTNLARFNSPNIGTSQFRFRCSVSIDHRTLRVRNRCQGIACS